jgi:hypothetical protein
MSPSADNGEVSSIGDNYPMSSLGEKIWYSSTELQWDWGGTVFKCALQAVSRR